MPSVFRPYFHSTIFEPATRTRKNGKEFVRFKMPKTGKVVTGEVMKSGKAKIQVQFYYTRIGGKKVALKTTDKDTALSKAALEQRRADRHGELGDDDRKVEQRNIPLCDHIATQEESPSRVMQGYDYCCTLFNAPNLPAGLWEANYVNSQDLYSPTLNKAFPAGTLLLNSPRAERAFSFGSSNRWTISARWSYQPQGWDQFWRVRNQGFAKQYLKGSSNDSYVQHKNYLPAPTNFLGLWPRLL